MNRSQWVTVAAALAATWVACAATADDGADPVAAYLAAWNATGPFPQALLAADFVDRSALLPLERMGFTMQAGAWRESFPDLRVTLLARAGAPGREVLRLRYEGSARDGNGLLPLSGARIAFEQTEWLTIDDRRIQSRQAYVDEWTLPTEWMFVAPPSVPLEPYAAEPIATFGAGSFLESIAISQDGRLFVSTGPDGGISIVGQDGRVQPHAQVNVGPGGLMMCLAFDAAGVLHASVHSADDGVRGVWRFAADGRGTRMAALPAGSVPNGLAVDARGNVYVADSFGGVLWRVNAGASQAEVWLKHAWLAPRPLVGRYPGANGLQIAQDAVYVAVSDRSLLLRVPIAADGTAGAPQIYASGLPGDDFAVARDGTLYVTTHPFNTVVRLGRDGRTTVVAGPGQGVVGPTAAAIGHDGSIYVVTDGGLYRPLPGGPLLPAVMRLSAPRH